MKRIFILSLKGFFFENKKQKIRETNKKKDAIKGAENNKKIPKLKHKYPIWYEFNLVFAGKIFIEFTFNICLNI